MIIIGVMVPFLIGSDYLNVSILWLKLARNITRHYTGDLQQNGPVLQVYPQVNYKGELSDRRI